MNFFLTFLITIFMFSCAETKESDIKIKLNNLKKQTVKIHNEILLNNQELEKISVDVNRNSQQQVIFNRYIKDKELLGRRLVFLLQDRIYISPFTRMIENMMNKSNDLVSRQIVREFFLIQVKEGIEKYFIGLEGIKGLEDELKLKQKNYEKKKKSLNKKLANLEKKIKQVAVLQKQIKTDKKLKIKEKKIKKKAKNLNELVQGYKKKKKPNTLKKTNIQFPVQGKIISNFGDVKDYKISKNGLVFKVSRESFVIAPIGGVIVFASQFKSYGNLVIIENNTGFFCILSGMESLLVSTGVEVLKGEPIAKISGDIKAKLYFELRQNGKIINPKSKVEIL